MEAFYRAGFLEPCPGCVDAVTHPCFVYVFVAKIFQYPVGHLAPKMIRRIVNSAADTVVLVRVIHCFKIYIGFYQRFDHLRTVLEMHIIVGRTVDQ